MRFKNRIRKNTAIVPMCTALVMVLTVLAGCGSKDSSSIVVENAAEAETYTILKVKTEKPSVGTIVNTSDFMGSITSGDTTNVVSIVSGAITSLNFEEGDFVNEGDVLFTIDDSQVKQGIATAEAAYHSAEASVHRVLGSALDSQAIQATSAYKNAEIGLDSAQFALNDLCSRIGDAKKSIREIDDSISNIESQVSSLASAISAETDPTKKAALEAQKQGLSGQIPSLEATKKTLESTKGQLEASVHQYENQIKTAQVGVDASTASLQEVVGNILNESMETAATSLNQAQVAVNNSKQSLKYYTITAPVSGVIDKINIEEFGIAQAGAPAYIIKTEDIKKAVFYISEASINKVSVGDVITTEYAGKPYSATISDIEDSVDPATGLFKVEATFDGDSEGLHVGSSVKVSVETDRLENTMIVPLEAIYYENENAYVFLEEDGVARKRFITTGIYDDCNVSIIDGLSADEDVIVTWSSKLKDGEKINVIN